MANNCKPTSSIPVPQPADYCCDIRLSRCVFYDGPNLCINVSQNAFLTQVLEELSEAICAPSTDVSSFNYQCLSSYNIDTEEDFANAVVDLLCQILGSEPPEDVTSITELLELIDDVQEQIDEFDDQLVQACFEPISGLNGTVTLAQIIQALQLSLCNLDTLIQNVDDKFVRITASDTTSGYLSDKFIAGTNAIITILNPAGNEQLQLAAGALITGELTDTDTPTVDTTISGVPLRTVSHDVQLSVQANNMIKLGASGLYVSAGDIVDYLVNTPSLADQWCAACGVAP